MAAISLSHSDDTLTLTIQGNFTFDVNREFRETYQRIPKKSLVTVDLTQVPYMDSAGLGMLLRLRDHTGGDPGSVRLVGANEAVRTILDVANFARLFRIE